MRVNPALMAAARFERKSLAQLTVKEFRALMQECFDADRLEMQRRKNELFFNNQRRMLGAQS